MFDKWIIDGEKIESSEKTLKMRSQIMNEVYPLIEGYNPRTSEWIETSEFYNFLN